MMERLDLGLLRQDLAIAGPWLMAVVKKAAGLYLVGNGGARWTCWLAGQQCQIGTVK